VKQDVGGVFVNLAAFHDAADGEVVKIFKQKDVGDFFVGK